MCSDAARTIWVLSEQLTRSMPMSRPRIGIGSLLVLAVAAGLVAWVLLDRNEPAVTVPAAPSSASADSPRIATVDGLSALAGLRGQPVFWVGAREGTVYELTENAEGQVFVRYLPSGTQVGSPRPDFLTVATYPRQSAFADIQAAAKRSGAVAIEIPGGLAVYDEAAPTSVYLAYRGSTQQIEVYAPSVLEARRVVESGWVRPVP